MSEPTIEFDYENDFPKACERCGLPFKFGEEIGLDNGYFVHAREIGAVEGGESQQ